VTSRRQKPAERPRSSFDVSGNQSRGVCGYADLLRAGAAGGEAEMAVLAAGIGGAMLGAGAGGAAFGAARRNSALNHFAKPPAPP